MEDIQTHVGLRQCPDDEVFNSATIVDDHHLRSRHTQFFASFFKCIEHFLDLCRRRALAKPLEEKVRCCSWMEVCCLWLLTQATIRFDSLTALRTPPFISFRCVPVLSTTV